jgi:hypothetical protein
MLAPLQTTVVDMLNVAANLKLKSYPRIATGPQVDGPTRYFFPVITSPDAVLHGSAFDFVDAVCKTTAAFHRPGARERLLASMISSVHAQCHEVPESLDADASWRSALEQSVSMEP